jgi:hypothetical protein
MECPAMSVIPSTSTDSGDRRNYAQCQTQTFGPIGGCGVLISADVLMWGSEQFWLLLLIRADFLARIDSKKQDEKYRTARHCNQNFRQPLKREVLSNSNPKMPINMI